MPQRRGRRGGQGWRLVRNRFKLGAAFDTIGYVICLETEKDQERKFADIFTASSGDAPCSIPLLPSVTTKFKLNSRVFLLVNFDDCLHDCSLPALFQQATRRVLIQFSSVLGPKS
jgi:hypothetical protein